MPGGGWEGQILTNLAILIDRVGPLKNFSRAGSPLSESSGSCGAPGDVCGRVLGIVGDSGRLNLSYFTCLGGSICSILYVARRPADPVKFFQCFIVRRFSPRASYFDICFCAPFGALRLSARLIGGRC